MILVFNLSATIESSWTTIYQATYNRFIKFHAQIDNIIYKDIREKK